MSKGEAEARRELRGYVAVARLGLLTAGVGLIAFGWVARGGVFDPDITGWPVLAVAAVWALGMVSVLWARARIRAWEAEDRSRADGEDTAEAFRDGEPDLWHADQADVAAHEAAEAERAAGREQERR